MPIYAYKCDSCGHAKDVLQKISDAPLSVCPSCGATSFKKQLTAAGFQLKGSGWYVTDFRGGNSGAPAEKPADAATSGTDSKPADAGSGAPSAPSSPAGTAAAPAPAPAAPPATPAVKSSGDPSSKASS